jgi:hypothetical protein
MNLGHIPDCLQEGIIISRNVLEEFVCPYVLARTSIEHMLAVLFLIVITVSFNWQDIKAIQKE